MPNFKLELFPEDTTKEQLKERAENLVSKIKKEHGNINEPSTQVFLDRDLLGLFSWRIFSYFDGHEESSEGEIFIRHQQILDSYSQEDIQEAYNIAANTCLLINNQHQFKEGHSVLHEFVSTNPNSLFYDSINPKMNTRIINGTFWEQLPRLLPSLNDGDSYSIVEPILTQSFKELETSFTPRGLKLFNNRMGSIGKFYLRTPESFASETQGLSERAIIQYGRFMKEIDSKKSDLNISTKELSPLVIPYLDVLNELDGLGNSLIDSEISSKLKQEDWLRFYL